MGRTKRPQPTARQDRPLVRKHLGKPRSSRDRQHHRFHRVRKGASALPGGDHGRAVTERRYLRRDLQGGAVTNVCAFFPQNLALSLGGQNSPPAQMKRATMNIDKMNSGATTANKCLDIFPSFDVM